MKPAGKRSESRHYKKAQKEAGTQETEIFELLAREWHTRFSLSWAENHALQIIRRFELYIFPWIGPDRSSPIDNPVKTD